MLWPGLNAPIVQGREVLRQVQLPPDEDRQKRLIELRSKLGLKKKFKVHPLERGWSGAKLHGRRLGPPDPIGEGNIINLSFTVVYFLTNEWVLLVIWLITSQTCEGI